MSWGAKRRKRRRAAFALVSRLGRFAISRIISTIDDPAAAVGSISRPNSLHEILIAGRRSHAPDNRSQSATDRVGISNMSRVRV